VRTVWRLRDQHIKDAGRCIQHMQKALIAMNVQLHNAISDLSGQTGQASTWSHCLPGKHFGVSKLDFQNSFILSTRSSKIGRNLTANRRHSRNERNSA